MNLFSAIPADAVLINRLDPNELLGTCSRHGFELEDLYWPSAEHYYQASKYQGGLREQIRASDHPTQARKLGRSIFRRKRSDWKKIRTTVMTRAIYTKCRAHQEVAEALLSTEDKHLADNAYGDYFWGVGRDGRGQNEYGKVLLRVRDKLRQEAKAEAQVSGNNQEGQSAET